MAFGDVCTESVMHELKSRSIILVMAKSLISTSSYLDDLLNNNPYFGGKVNRIYPPELQFNKTNACF